MPGTLEEVEVAFSVVEEAVKLDDSLNEKMLVNKEILISSLDLGKTAEKMDVSQELYDSMMDLRWLQRRIDYVIEILSIMIRLYPLLFGECLPTLGSFRTILNEGPILVKLRFIAENNLHEIPKPVGLNPCQSRIQRPQEMDFHPP